MPKDIQDNPSKAIDEAAREVLVSGTEEKTVKDLQKELVALGMPEEDTQKFQTKATLIATINTLRAVSANQKVTTLEPKIDIQEEKKIEKKWLSKAENMRSVLEAQPKVRIMIPLDPKEKPGVVNLVYNPKTGRKEQVYVSGAVHPFTNNGYKYLVPKGIYVSVPQQIADMIEERFGQVSEVSERLLIDRIDPETGKPVRNQL